MAFKKSSEIRKASVIKGRPEFFGNSVLDTDAVERCVDLAFQFPNISMLFKFTSDLEVC